jgi:hypothetical protein
MAKKQNPEWNKKKTLQALERHLGVIQPAIKEAGICRQTFYYYMRTDPVFKQAVEDIHEATTDFVENELFKKIKEGSEKSIIFYMKHKGRKRGYSDTLDITTGGEKITEIRLLKVERKEDWEDDGDA